MESTYIAAEDLHSISTNASQNARLEVHGPNVLHQLLDELDKLLVHRILRYVVVPILFVLEFKDETVREASLECYQSRYTRDL